MRIIDTPSPFAPAAEWREFLAEMLTVTPRDARERKEVDEQIALARRELTAPSSHAK